jgi:hypothetical protein
MLGALIVSNALCLFLHLWLTPASAGEATRGYLHGGLVMDFIGQAGPSSRIHLSLLDMLLIALQLTHMAAYMLKTRLKDAATASTSTTTRAASSSRPASALRQDLDAEERGVVRSDEQQDIEMQTLGATGQAVQAVAGPSDAEEISSERDTLLNPVAPRTDAHIFDAFHSGQIVIADLNLRKCIKDQVQLIKEYRADPQASSGIQTLRSELANRMLRMRSGADVLRQGIQ